MMTSITIPLSDDHVAKLKRWAEKSGLTPEEFLHQRLDLLLEEPTDRFEQALTYVLQKNAELYRRLA